MGIFESPQHCPIVRNGTRYDKGWCAFSSIAFLPKRQLEVVYEEQPVPALALENVGHGGSSWLSSYHTCLTLHIRLINLQAGSNICTTPK